MPFNIGCGHYRNCEEQYTRICPKNVNPGFAGGAYDYIGMGPYMEEQAEYLRVPYADFNVPKNYLIRIICLRKILFYLPIYFLLDGVVLHSQVSNQEKQ